MSPADRFAGENGEPGALWVGSSSHATEISINVWMRKWMDRWSNGLMNEWKWTKKWKTQEKNESLSQWRNEPVSSLASGSDWVLGQVHGWRMEVQEQDKLQPPEWPHVRCQKVVPGWHFMGIPTLESFWHKCHSLAPLPPGLREKEDESPLSNRRRDGPSSALSEGRVLTHSLPPLGSHSEL